MRFIHLLPLSALTLASTQSTIKTKRQNQTCGAQEWNIQGFESFQLPTGYTPAPGTPFPYTTSHLTFTFVDPNFGVSGECQWDDFSNSGQLTDCLFYPCGNGMSYQYCGAGEIILQRTPVPCDNATYTETGAGTLSLECFDLYGGQSCETVTQTNVAVSQLQQV